MTIETVMEKRGMTKAEVNSHIGYIFSSDTKYAIIYVLGLYQMLNLKAIAKMLGKSSSTIHKHLEDLTERKYIRVANTVKGKFYELTELVKDIEAAQQQQFEERDFEQEIAEYKNMSDEQFLELTLDKFDDPQSIFGTDLILNFTELMSNATSTMKAISQISISATGEAFFHLYLIYLLRLLKKEEFDKFHDRFNTIQEHSEYGEKVSSYLERQEWAKPKNSDQYKELIISGIAEKKYRGIMDEYWGGTLTMSKARQVIPIGSTDQSDFFIKISNLDQLARYFEVLIAFIRELKRIEKEFNEENKGIPEEQLTTQILNLFSGPLGKL